MTVRACRYCSCTDDDCSGCIARTGRPCRWIAEDVCSACLPRSQDDLVRKLTAEAWAIVWRLAYRVPPQLVRVDVDVVIGEDDQHLAVCLSRRDHAVYARQPAPAGWSWVR